MCGTGAGARTSGCRTGGSAGGGTASSRGSSNVVRTGILRTGARKTGTSASTRGHVLLGVTGHSREVLALEVAGVPGVARGRAGGRSAVRVVTAIARRSSVVGECILEVGEIVVGGNRRTRDGDKTVARVLLRVLVDETTTVDASHLLVVESRNFLELASVLVAAVFGKEERQTVVAVGLNLLVPTRDGEGRGVTPRVVVECKEVAALVIGSAVHVLGSLVAVRADIGSGVANRNGTVASVVAVLLEITSDGLDVRSTIGSVAIVDDLVTGEEKKGVGVVGKGINSGEETLQVDGVVRDGGLIASDRVQGSVDIESNVDSSLGKSVHASIVVDAVVNSVDTDGVDAKLLEVLDVTLATSLVGQRVLSVRRATGLVVDTTDVEAVVAGEEGVALDGNGRKAARRSARGSGLEGRRGNGQRGAQGDRSSSE